MAKESSLHILVVEDDSDTQANLCDILELDGHRVETARSMSTALDREDWSKISAIILDRQLPDGSAIDFLPELNRLAPHAPVIVVTAHPDIEGAVVALREGAYDYLLKPINPGALRAGVKRIAERQRAQKRLEESEARNRALLNAIPDTIFRLRRDGVFLDVRVHRDSDLATDTGIKIGTSIRESNLPRSVIRQFTVAVRHALNDDVTQIFEFKLPKASGSCHYEVRVVKSGEEEVVAIVRDVTEHKRAERRLLQTERLAAIGQMVAGLAHESRNAFQRSQASLEMLAMEVEDMPEALELVERIQRAQDHLHHLYEEVRSYAAPIQLVREKCDLQQIWRATWAHLEVVRREKKIQIRQQSEPVDLTCAADPHALEQLFRNILENAIVACSDPGEILVSFRETRIDRRPAIEVAVRDNGPGIEPDVRAQVFEPFFTTKTKGTGLGMAIAKRIVEAHGGYIFIADDVASGAEIRFGLPRS